jgi:hypothetical protein
VRMVPATAAEQSLEPCLGSAHAFNPRVGQVLRSSKHVEELHAPLPVGEMQPGSAIGSVERTTSAFMLRMTIDDDDVMSAEASDASKGSPM